MCPRDLAKSRRRIGARVAFDNVQGLEVMPIRVWLRLLTVEASRSLGRNKVRTALAVLAIMMGVSTVILVVAIGRAGKESALQALDDLGDNLVWIEAGSRNASGVRTGSHGMTTLLPSDADAIRAEVPLIAKVSENIDGRIQIIYGGLNWSSQFRGVSPDYPFIRRWQIARGEFFTADDVAEAHTVIVIGDTVRRRLFGEDDPLGEQVRIKSSSFMVIGTLAPKGQSATGQDQDDTMMMPWTTVRRRLVGKDVTWLDDVLCSATSTDDIPQAAAQVANLMRDRHHIAAGAEDDFNIRHPEDLLKSKVKSAETLEILLFIIASMALLVGGIGIMNVMLAAGAQRTTEIGLRMSVGARPQAIQIQFLGEAVMLTVVGGSLGVLIAVSCGPFIAAALDWQIAMTTRNNLLALAFSIAVGVFFGFYPATRASLLDPIEALRTE